MCTFNQCAPSWAYPERIRVRYKLFVVFVKKLLDCGMYRVRCSCSATHRDIHSHTQYPVPSFQRPSAVNSQHLLDNFANFMRRLAFALASTSSMDIPNLFHSYVLDGHFNCILWGLDIHSMHLLQTKLAELTAKIIN